MMARILLSAFILCAATCTHAARQDYAVTLRVEQVQGIASLKGATAHATVTVDDAARTAFGSVTQILYKGRAFKLGNVRFGPVPVTLDAAGIRARVTTAEVAAGAIAVPASVGLSVKAAAIVSGGPAQAFIQRVYLTGTAIPRGPPVIDPPKPPPAPNPTGQRLYVGLTRFWSRTDPTSTARLIASAGATGRSYELIELEPSSIRTPAQMTAYLLDQVRKIIPHLQADASAAIGSKVCLYNANARKEAMPSVAQWKQIIDAIAPYLGNSIVTVFNEPDLNVPDSIRNGAEAHLRTKIPKERLFYTETQVSWAKFWEYHPANLTALPGPRNSDTFLTPDHPWSLNALGANIGQSPNLAAAKNHAALARKSGLSYDAYNFYEKIDLAWIAAVMSGWGVSVAPGAPPVVSADSTTGQAPAAGDAINIDAAVHLGPHANTPAARAVIDAQLKTAKREGGNVRLTVGPITWPSDNSPIGANIQGRVYVFWVENGVVYGGHFDWFRPNSGTIVKELKNIGAGYLSGRRPPAGADLFFCLVSNDGKRRTNVVRGGSW